MDPEPHDANGPPALPLTVLHVMVRVSVAVCPVQDPLPLTVSVAVKEPEDTDGANVAFWGDPVFCVHEPRPPPPVHTPVPNVPPALAPLILIDDPETHVLILEPALDVGGANQVMVRL
jgi:hypothetical protein